ncbi:hypothetical protein [Tenacibaculum maritimum]|uniref:hypothetical protein n=1 Tax=Tenacibaculum maritimum TaxID=107401 RepID=UPI0012E67B9A|nr:hypothetical protein [Tenacibaculum maritimum]MCD9563795.1 hypothetical protein [Tenacibaculum maritimum]MCD9566827.1 hypothetical protein [Tenacibaculum maritimum]MCD9580153.1 hypothetical protein [Tenacibaculum maritimum]MCD9597676.1 hypothetical protein [Tenacibaculum maritimum]MCD9614796.1 hypothetical protein [Tenacibaculum maritimum]
MKKGLLIILLSLTFNSTYSQQFEIGPNLGYGFVNIVDSKSDNDRAVIGDALWNPNFGFNAVYYFKNPNLQTTGRIGLLYKNNKRGSVSELNSDNKFEFNANTFGLFGGVAGNIGNGFILYLDIGFGINTIDNSNFYEGSLTQTEAFEDLSENLEIKSSEVTFLYSIGLEKEIIENRLKIFLELNGDAAISKLNENNGTFRTQSLGFGTGLRYIFDLRKKE